MRKAVMNASTMGIDVIMTLHDALYVECDFDKASETVEILAKCMAEAVAYYFLDTPVEQFAICRQDPQAWGYGFTEGEIIPTSVGDMYCQPRYMTPRTLHDIERFKKYMTPDELAEFV